MTRNVANFPISRLDKCPICQMGNLLLKKTAQSFISRTQFRTPSGFYSPNVSLCKHRVHLPAIPENRYMVNNPIRGSLLTESRHPVNFEAFLRLDGSMKQFHKRCRLRDQHNFPALVPQWFLC